MEKAKQFAYWLIFAASVLLSQAGWAADTTDLRTVQVKGQASIPVAPDKLVFFMTLERRGETAGKLYTEIEAKADAIVTFLLRQGIDESDIQAMQMQLSPWFEHSREGRKQRGLQFTRTIQVQLRNLESYPAVLDGVTKLGIERLDGFSYQIDNERDYYLQAVEQAISDANARANVMMAALGYQTHGVVSVQEHSVYQPMPKMAAMTRSFAAESGQAGQVSNLPGLIQINADVAVLFEIKPIPDI